MQAFHESFPLRLGKICVNKMAWNRLFSMLVLALTRSFLEFRTRTLCLNTMMTFKRLLCQSYIENYLCKSLLEEWQESNEFASFLKADRYHSKTVHVTIPCALHGHVTFPIFSEATFQTARGWNGHERHERNFWLAREINWKRCQVTDY